MCESYSRDSTGNGKKKWKYGKTWRRRACLPKLRCTCPAPSKISSTTFLEIEQPISRSLALLTGGSRPACFRPMECIHSYWGTETQRPSGLAIEKSFFGYYILIFFIYTAYVVCDVTFFGSFAHPDKSHRQFQLFRKSSHTCFVHKKYNCNLTLE